MQFRYSLGMIQLKRSSRQQTRESHDRGMDRLKDDVETRGAVVKRERERVDYCDERGDALQSVVSEVERNPVDVGSYLLSRAPSASISRRCGRCSG